jgi:SpoIID/LytB domain protein
LSRNLQRQPAPSSIALLVCLPLSDRLKAIAAATCTTICLMGMAIKPAMAQTPPDPILDIGVVQRFGAEPEQKLMLQPLTGDRLTIRFETSGREQTINTTSPVTLAVNMQPQAQVTERVVLSTHRSFESAEDSANQWQSKGIEVEIAQPSQWQVWAKRGTYSTPLLRRLLLENLQSNGAHTVSLETQTQQQVPKAVFEVSGYRYQRDRLEISSTNRRVYVTPNEEVSDRRLYAGTLKLQPNAYGTYTLVNQVPLETYLRGVVPHEIGSSAPTPTIEAQAVLARTYVLRNLRRFAIDNYQLCADTQCQVYEGLTGVTDNVDQAIATTRGLVLTYQNELVDALYSSTTGGITAAFSDMWNGADRPYLHPVVDSAQSLWDLDRYPLSNERNLRTFISRTQGFNEQGWDQFRWHRQSTLSEIATGLKQYLQNRQNPRADFTQIRQIQVAERSPGGRVQKVIVQTDRGNIELNKDEILRALYPPTSTLFYLEPIYETAIAPTRTRSALPVADPQKASALDSKASGLADSAVQPSTQSRTDTSIAQAQPSQSRVIKGYAFVGGGLGHGVGMSQTGAYKLGDLGWSHAKILSFYYPGTQLQPLSDAITFWREPSAPTTNTSSQTAPTPNK